MDLPHEERLTKCEDRAKSNTRRIEKIEERQDNLEELIGTVKVLASRQEVVESDVKEIKNEVKEINAKPGKRWESLIEKVVMALAAALVGFLLAQIGL